MHNSEAIRSPAGFRNPPDFARPRTWWHWTMSNVTRDGITKDLERQLKAGGSVR